MAPREPIVVIATNCEILIFHAVSTFSDHTVSLQFACCLSLSKQQKECWERVKHVFHNN